MANGSYNVVNSQNYNDSNQPTGFFSKLLRNVSNWGMYYDDMVTRNKISIGINEDPNANMTGYDEGGMYYDLFSQRAVSSLLSKKSISYLDKSYPDKRRILKEYSIKDEIREFIESISDEAIIYDDEKKFCTPSNLPGDTDKEMKEKYNEFFEEIYSNFGFNDGKKAWELFRQFIIEGYIAFEIVYDDKQQNIIGLEQMDPNTLIPGYDPSTGTAIWIQYAEDPSLRRIMLDANVIYISYKSQDDYSSTSYVENLIRPYNQLKLIEQTKIMFNIVNATVHQKITIPVKDLSRQRAEEAVSTMIANYNDEVEWDDTMGTIEINGQKHLPLNKQLWFPEGESGTPDFELISPEGHNLNENDMLDWFYNALKRASRIPFTRFDRDTGGGNIYSDAAEMTRDEAKFSNFIGRLRTSFKEILTKPLRLQMLLEFPELKDDKSTLNSIGIDFKSNDLFEEWKRLNNLQKRVEIAEQLSNALQIGDRPYFHTQYLVDKILKLTEKEKQENEAYWKKHPIKSEEEGEDEFGGMDTDFGGGDEFSAGGGEESGLEDLGDLEGGDTDFGGEDFGGGDEDVGGTEDTGGGDEDFDF